MYRDEKAVLEERQRSLRKALDETSRELSDVDARLQDLRRRLPIAHTLIASPCDVPWESMVGDHRVRHCKSCARDVHNLSAMTRDEVEAFLLAANPDQLPCISLFQRADGTMLTADCPVGMGRRRKRAFISASLGTGAAAIVGFTALAFLSFQPRRRPRLDEPKVVEMTKTVAPFGYISLEGDPGTKVYEGDELRGVVPMAFQADVGAHALRFESTKGEVRDVIAMVNKHDVSHVRVTFAKPEGRRTGGVPYRPHRPKL